MRHALASTADFSSPAFILFPTTADPKELFEQRFRCALSQCVRRGFQVEECFGLIWEETLEIVELNSREQTELYPELIDWARRWIQ